jgi:cysteine synthase A
VVSLICDSGERYADTYYDEAWLADHDLKPDRYTAMLQEFEQSCAWPVPTL